MAEASQIVFSFKEVAEALIKKHGLSEGLWALAIKFGIQATNMGPNDNELRPTAIIPILEIGLQKMDKESNLTVDAAKVNPKGRSRHN
jgi:hypothetical protein